MYDLHCHLLPAIDDGPVDLDTALEMARLAVADGITTIACTPHIYPGVYENTADGIRSAIELFRSELAGNGIALTLVKARTFISRPILPMAFAMDAFPRSQPRAICCSSHPITSLRLASRKRSSSSCRRASCPSLPIPSD